MAEAEMKGYKTEGEGEVGGTLVPLAQRGREQTHMHDLRKEAFVSRHMLVIRSWVTRRGELWKKAKTAKVEVR